MPLTFRASSVMGMRMSKKPDLPEPKQARDPRVIIPMPAELVERIDDFRFKTRSPSRAEAVRELLDFALEQKLGARK